MPGFNSPIEKVITQLWDQCFLSTEYGTEKGEEKHRGRKEKLRLADTVACCCLNCVRTKELKETLHSPFPKLFFFHD